MNRSTVPSFIRWMYGPQVLWHVATQRRELYLTFDDGPIPEVTPDVLIMLQRYSAKATFFMVGENAARYPHLVKQIRQEGHTVGNHSFNHLKGWKTPGDNYYANVEKADALLHSHLFRPPHGQISLAQARMLAPKYRLVMWTVLSGDYDARLDPDTCFKRVKKYAGPGAIIVFHDSLKAKNNMFEALELTLRYFAERDYVFKALPENAGDLSSM